MFKVIIIGAGEIGTAIGKILKKKGIEPIFWDKNPLKIRNQKPLAEIIPSANFIFLCIPSWAMREAISNILPMLSKKTIIISLAKGIEKRTNKTMGELLKEFFPKGQKFALLSGPMIAEELMKNKFGAAVLATKQKIIYNKTADLFKKTNLKIEYSNDIRGVALAVVLKNIYAVLLGISDGLRQGDNKKGELLVEAVKEMADIIQTFGGKKETAYGIAGLGDLIATGFSRYSKNRQFGEELVRIGKKTALKAEGAVSLEMILNLLNKRKNKFLLLADLRKKLK